MITRMRLSFVYAVFVSFCLSNQLCAERVTEFAKPVQNLSVIAVRDGRYTEIKDSYKFLKLNISWIPSSNSRRWPPYSVVITGGPNMEETNRMKCPEESIHYGTSSNNVLLPETDDPTGMPELYIQPNCFYTVEVIANPRTRNTTNSQVLYKVPECVDNVCSCPKVESTLPVPIVNVTQKEHQIVINWSTSSNASNVSFYQVRIGVFHFTSKKGLPVYNATKLGEVPAGTTMFLWNLTSAKQYAKVKDSYEVTVNAVNSRGCTGGKGSFIINSTLLNVKTTIGNHNIWFILCGALSGCILFGVLGLILYPKYNFLSFHRTNTRIHAISKYKSHWTEAILQKDNILYSLYRPEEIHKEKTDNLQIPFKNIALIRELGTGQFGKVYLGCLNDEDNTLIAVKMSQENGLSTDLETQQQFMKEIEIMRMAGTHPNLVNLLGYCIQPNESICIVLEYMQGGDLLTYLHTFRSKGQSNNSIENSENTLEGLLKSNISETLYSSMYEQTTNKLGQYMNIISNCKGEMESTKYFVGEIEEYLFLKFAVDIAMGMEHLDMKGITHRDLAARNILLSADLTVKISDFGLSRNGIYMIENVEEKSRRLPIRWMSPESLRDRVFSPKSDVWSYGIVLWEISTLGAFPYSNVQDHHFVRYIIHENGRLEKPDNVPSCVYNIMCSCWAAEPEDRPNFTQLLSELETVTISLSSLRSVSNPCYTLTFSNENT